MQTIINYLTSHTVTPSAEFLIAMAFISSMLSYQGIIYIMKEVPHLFKNGHKTTAIIQTTALTAVLAANMACLLLLCHAWRNWASALPLILIGFSMTAILGILTYIGASESAKKEKS